MSKNEYEPLDMSQMESELARMTVETGASTDDYLSKYVRLPERDGFVMMRFLPIKKGQKLWCVTRVHTLFDPSTRRKLTYHCPRELVNSGRGERWVGDCIICKYYSDLWQKSESLSGKAQEDLQAQARSIKPVERYYYNVIVRSAKNKDGVIETNVGPKIYSCGKVQHAKIIRAIYGDPVAGEKGLGDITHPLTGRDFKVVKKVVKGGGGMEYPNYDNSKFEDQSPLGTKDEIAMWMEKSNDLQSLRSVKSQDEIKDGLRIHLGMIKSGNDPDNNDLEEFRNVGSSTSASVSMSSSKVKDEVKVSKSEETSEDADLMADDEFMKELGSM